MFSSLQREDADGFEPPVSKSQTRRGLPPIGGAVPPEILGEVLRFVSSWRVLKQFLLVSKRVKRYIEKEDPECAAGVLFRVSAFPAPAKPDGLCRRYVSRLCLKGNYSKQLSAKFIKSLFPMLPGLRDLFVLEASNLTDVALKLLSRPLVELSLTKAQQKFDPMIFATPQLKDLESLSLVQCSGSLLRHADMSLLTKLTKLHVEGYGEVFDFAWSRIRAFAGNLTKLTIFRNGFSRAAGATAAYFRKFPKLEVLEVNGVSNVKRQHFAGFRPANLRKFHFIGCDGWFSETQFFKAIPGGRDWLLTLEDYDFQEYVEESDGDVDESWDSDV